ncbi:tubulin polymerization-promoting protein homolog [Lepeophtheirus salmonis]|uniref:tubulin polymerization-promoting protein homolog n=1 Tax=Lepeophtheirus salmonis TaxID=72036 RepID=UPI001AEB7175|nr:tubulin polymerization-promoting protein homolog [Lepeophtheirus salmonis]
MNTEAETLKPDSDAVKPNSEAVMPASEAVKPDSVNEPPKKESDSNANKLCSLSTDLNPADEVKVDKKAFKEQFEAYSKFGDKSSDGKTIKLSQGDKWFKQAKLFDGKKLSTTDTGIAFRKVGKNAVKLSFTDWNKYLDELSSTKKMSSDTIKSKLTLCGKPGLSKTTSVTKSPALDRLTDPSRYGGTHKERFDTTGKGKGKVGREDPKSQGYVSGYKHKGTYDANKK